MDRRSAARRDEPCAEEREEPGEDWGRWPDKLARERYDHRHGVDEWDPELPGERGGGHNVQVVHRAERHEQHWERVGYGPLMLG